MKTALESDDIQAIAIIVFEQLKPLLTNTGKKDDDTTIFDVHGLAKHLNVTTQWIYERVHLKEIPHYKVRKFLPFRQKAIDRWLETHEVMPIPKNVRLGRMKGST